MMIAQVKLIVQGVSGAPAPACTNLIGSLVGGTHVTLIVDLIDWQIAAPGPRALVVVDLSAIDQPLDRLNLYKACSVKTITDTLVVSTLAVDQTENRIAGIRSVIEHTHVLQVVVTEIAAVSVIYRNQRVATQGSREHVGVLVTNLDTLTLLVAIVYILTNLDDVKIFICAAQNNMVGIHTHGETTIV